MSKSVFVCQSCSQVFPKWVGQCGSCGEWNSLVEEVAVTNRVDLNTKRSRVHESAIKSQAAKSILAYDAIGKVGPTDAKRIPTLIPEFDRVLGASHDEKSLGVVPGALMLIGGEPGIGKSTLLTQVVLSMLLAEKKKKQGPYLYVSGEESPSQIDLRIKRLQQDPSYRSKLDKSRLQFVTTTDVDVLTEVIAKAKPRLVVVDSVQTITTSQLTGAAGSVGQVKEVAERLRVMAKKTNTPIFLIGHVTKEGKISGPKVLEHIVDTVLELSGERTGELRLLRSLKNRFGATDEVGVFRVTNFGFSSVKNPSEFLIEHAQRPVPGSATTCIMEGTRPLLIEVQALAVASQLAMPRRVGRGIELARIQVLTAVLQKHYKLPLATTDVFASAVGGFVIKEPAVDLGLAVAIASSLKNKPLPPKLVLIGEVGLLGELRAVSLLDRRVKESKRLGFKKIISRKTHQALPEVLKHLGL